MNVLVLPMIVLLVLWSACAWRVLATGPTLSPLHGWIMGLSFFVVLPLAIIVANGGYSVPAYYGVQGNWGTLDLSDQRFTAPFLLVWAALMLTALSAAYACHARGAAGVRRAPEIDDRKLRRGVWICIGLIFFDIGLNVYVAGGFANYFLQHWYTRNDDLLASHGELFVIYLFSVGLGLPLVLTALACACVHRKLQAGKGTALLAVAAATLGLNMVFSGNRIFVALFLLYVLASLAHRRRFKALAKMMLLAPLLVVVFAVWAQVRGALSDPLQAVTRHIESASAYEGNYALNRLIDATEGTNIIFLLNITKDFGEKYQYLEGETFLKALTFWIPRSFYPGKSDGFTIITARLYEPGVDTSIASTILGELYANFGPFSLVLLPLMTSLIGLLDRWMIARVDRTMLFSTMLFLAFAWLARASFSDNMIMIAASALLVWALRLQAGFVLASPGGIPSHERAVPNV